MKKDCILIATLPSFNNLRKVEKVFMNPHISEVRFNTGVQTAYSIDETLSILIRLSIKYNKMVWIDIKGRQLRVTKWADPLYSCIELNHRVEVSYPAQVYFRNGDIVDITHIKNGNQLFVDPLPREALGAGQSVNIFCEDINIDGYLTKKDKQYLNACKKMRLHSIMASFVESSDDLREIIRILPDANIVSKIESLKGISFISNSDISNLMAARDDLYLQSGQNYSMMEHLKTIIKKDSGAICASKIFSSLEKREYTDFADFADLELMYNMGYRKFMLCDNICNFRFEAAIKSWEEFING